MKYKGIEVKTIEFVWRLPWLSRYKAFVVPPFPIIFVAPNILNNLQSDSPSPKSISFLAHEIKHLERQKQMGWIKFGFLYLISPKFRLEEELAAIKAAMIHLKKNKQEFDIDRAAKGLSSYLYLWMTSYENAKRELEKIWKEV